MTWMWCSRSPSVEYEVVMRDGQVQLIDSPADLPEEGDIAEIREPWMKIQIFTPTEFYGVVMDTATKHRGVFIDQEYPAPNRVLLQYEIPLSEVIVDFFDQLEIAHAWLCLAGLPILMNTVPKTW